MLVACILKGITPFLRNTYTSNVYLCRNLILNSDCMGKGVSTRSAPLGGMNYDWLMWIDSDMVYTPENLFQLLKLDKDISSGSAMTDPKVKRLNWGLLNEEGKCNFVLKDDVPSFPRTAEGLAEVDFVGFSWLLVRRGVFEKIPFPWFRPITTQYKDTRYFPSEDIGWCHSAKENGFKIYVDPECHIGHEKPVVMMG